MNNLVIFFMMSCILAKWTEPVILASKDDLALFPSYSQFHHEDSTRVVLPIFHEDSQLTELGFRIHHSKTNTFEPMVKITNQHNCKLAQLIENPNGKDLYVLCMGIRSADKISEKCDKESTSGCRELFFMESKDKGVTWSTPRPLHYLEPNDVADRRGGSMLYIEETDRIFVYYMKFNSEREHEVCFVTRPSGSLIFSTEYCLFKPEEPVHNYAIQVKLAKIYERKVYYLFFIQENFSYYTYSYDGVHWNNQQIELYWVRKLHEDLSPVQAMMYNVHRTPLCMAMVLSHKNGIVSCIDIHDDKFNNDYEFGKDLMYIHSDVCKNNNTMSAIIAKTDYDTLKLFFHNALTRGIKEYSEIPLKDESSLDFPKVSCEFVSKTSAIIKVMAYNKKSKVELFTTNTIDFS